MGKIGCVIAYYKNHNNYGTSLQGYATIKILSELGYNPRIIKYVKKDSLLKRIKNAPFQFISGGYTAYRNKRKKQKKFISDEHYFTNLQIRTKVNNEWKERYMDPLCDTYLGYNNLCNASKSYDLILVGSDQVWTPLSLYSKFYNLLFVDDSVPTMSYASSFGVSKIPWWQKRETSKYLSRIKALSVRELKAKEIVDSLTSKSAKVVLDPTFLLTKDQWLAEVKNYPEKIKEKYIFCYLLGKRKEIRDEILKLSKKTGLKIVTIRHTDEYIDCDENFGDYAPYDINPIEFLSLINNAEYICTDSFHCTVFSIIFNRPFITFYRFLASDGNSRNSRIDSLLQLMKLECRLYSGDIITQMINPIDYDIVNSTIINLRKDSLRFLQSGLSLIK